MAKMNIEIPIVAATLLFRQDYFDTISDSLNVRFFNVCFAWVWLPRKPVSLSCPSSLSLFTALDKNVSGGRKAGEIRGATALLAPTGAPDVIAASWTVQHQCECYIVMLGNILRSWINKIKHKKIKILFYIGQRQWTNPKWSDFYEDCKEAISKFDILVGRVHDIYANRILQVLTSMQDVTLQTLPTQGMAKILFCLN